MTRAYFLTGTDTEIGKTYITCALLHRAGLDGLRAVGLKPVAAGTNIAGLNDDVEAIRAASNVKLPREIINPYCFEAAIAPHIAAAEEGRHIEYESIKVSCEQAGQQADLVIVEGVGGFCVLPVILVIGMRLGCINHALLTAEAITARGLKIAGWVANRIDPAMSRFDENLATLRSLLPAPLLGVVPYEPTGGTVGAAGCLQLPDT